MSGWLKFFLTSVVETAKNGVDTFKQVLLLNDAMDELVVKFGRRSQKAKDFINFLYQRPLVSVTDIIEPLMISKQTANILVRNFVDNNILVEATGFQRNKVFVFKKYLDIYSQT